MRIGLQLLLVIFLLIAVGWAVPCPAVENIPWSRYDKWEIARLEISGAPPELASELAGGLEMTGQWQLLRGRRRPPFTDRLLARDMARMRVFLAERGYPKASITPHLRPLGQAKRLEVLLELRPGKPVRVEELEFPGWPGELATPDGTEALLPTTGEIYTDAGSERARLALTSRLHEAGYAQAEVGVELGLRAVPADSESEWVRLRFPVSAGEVFVFGSVAITGCAADLLPLAGRVIDVAPGTRYAASRVTQATRDLRLTQLFRQVDLTTVRTGPGSLQLRAELENGRMRIWDASLGTWSDNPWKIRSGWTHRNLFGRGRGFNARGALATHEFEGGVGVFWLGWLAPQAQTRLGLDVLAQYEDAYESREYRAALVQSFRPRNRDVLHLGTAVSRTSIRSLDADGSTPEPEGRLWEFWFDRKWDRVDDPLFPTRGGFVKVNATLAEPWLWSEVPYVAGQIDAVRYFDLPLGLLFSGRLRAGMAWPLADAVEVIANRRFHAGGYNTHRGYDRRGLGPRDSDDRSLGGEAVALLGAEVRFPIVWQFEGVLFVDAGNLWASPVRIDPADLPVAAGGALGLRTPLGPVRLGYAVNVADLVPDQPRRLWHFGIGYPW